MAFAPDLLAPTDPRAALVTKYFLDILDRWRKALLHTFCMETAKADSAHMLEFESSIGSVS